ncbi:hypothetical protein LTR37_019479 [Vermiconidia calcicola]|uniref:Uncharacterized protein n=1 Tax=Vermiconidia calcicola TaxID=1690605 RepID=A0ACC3MF79_9PEZI|nr:hypothetical protein LTR37_019479 [Vermiconidia calcicola]
MTSTASRVVIPVDGEHQEFSAILLRDLCQCSACIHHSTRQKLYSTADIPRDIQAQTITPNQSMPGVCDIRWDRDVPGFGSQHTTSIDADMLRGIGRDGATPGPFQSSLAPQTLWDAESSRNLPDFEYDAYMKDDATLYKAIVQLRTHGLVFLTDVSESEKAVSSIAERIGSVKSTFYGYTWDVRTVPSAINAAYTSSDLGFHTDLLYFQNPAHVQLLHCMQSSSSGGASVFADALKCAIDLYQADVDAFSVLATLPVNYHYKHPDSNLYSATKPVFDTRPLRIGDVFYKSLPEFLEAWGRLRQGGTRPDLPSVDVVDCLEKINWGPPFLAPFSLHAESMEQVRSFSSATTTPPRECLNRKVEDWHAAAAKFSAVLHREANLHERLMKPGECVLFDNTRVLHARKGFEAGDVGKARWLRGAYVDKEPYLSRYRVLRYRFEGKLETMRDRVK